MKNKAVFVKPKRYAKFLKFGISKLLLLVLFLGYFSCSQKAKEKRTLPHTSIQTIKTVHLADLPPPVKAIYLDPDSVVPPITVPLKYEPKIVPAHPNVHPIGTPKVVQIPNDLKIVLLGEDVPMPEIIPAKGLSKPVFQPKPIPAKATRMGDAAIFDIQYLTQDEGLPFGEGKSILEDSKGYIWFGGRAGITRYDGKNFFPYTKKEGMPSTPLTMEDSEGNIWFASKSDLGYFDGKNVIHFGEQEGLENNWWNAIFEDSKGLIWLGTNKGVYRYDGQNFTFFKKGNGLSNNASKEKGFFFDDRINDILEDSRGDLWWATSGSGVLRYDGQRIIHYTKKEGLIDNYISCILEDSKGQIWFASGGEGVTSGKGVSRYKPNSLTAQGFGGTFTNYTSKEGLSGNRIVGMVEDDLDNIWLATYASGLTRFDGQNFLHFTTEEGLSNNAVISIMKDSKKNIWFGLNGHNGVNRFKPYSFRHFTKKQGLSKNWITSILEDRKENVWIGTGYGGLIKYDGQNFINYSEQEDLLKDYPNPSFEDKQGNIWFTTRDKGLNYFDGKVFRNFGVEQGFINSNHFHTHLDKEGRIWVNTWSATEEGRSIRYNPRNGQVTHFLSNNKEGIGGGSIFEDKQHNLWFGGKGCVAKYDALNDQFNYVLQLDIDNSGWVDLLMEDDSDNLWFSLDSDTRVFKMKKNGDNTTVPSYSSNHGFPDFQIKSVSIDKDKNVWFSSQGNGIGVFPDEIENFNASERTWIRYDKADGLRSRNFVHQGSYIDHKNRLWAGTADAGITMLDLNTFELPTEAPKSLSLSHIDIQQQFIDFSRKTDTAYSRTLAFEASLNQSYDSVFAFNNYPTTLALPYHLNHLTFHFSAIDWTAPHKIQYTYQIEGIDKTWSPLSSKAEADYRNLPYGTHTFKVKTIGAAQVWTAPFEYTFTIHPPWWHTWWAYGLYALFAFGISGWYIQRLRRQINQKQQQLNRELYLNEELAITNKKLAEINVANSRFVPNDFLQMLGKESLLDLNLGDQTEATMTILFADIRDYTTISEQISPEENFKLINTFLGRMGPIIQKNGGFICQYMGDGIMALFKEKHDLAITAAIEMQTALQRYNKKRFVRNRQALRVGIGLNTGKLMLGVIGDKNRYESSVISDAVNTASRMEGLTKIFGCGVIVSEKTLAEIEGRLLDDFPSSSNLKSKATKLLDNRKLSSNTHRFLGKVKVKGKNQTLKIYDFFDGDEPIIRELKTETKVNFEKAIHHYLNKEFGKAADLLKVIAAKFPEDIATEYYLTKAVKYVIEGVDADWSGVEEMVNK